jgi:hypothetical protein
MSSKTIETASGVSTCAITRAGGDREINSLNQVKKQVALPEVPEQQPAVASARSFQV